MDTSIFHYFKDIQTKEIAPGYHSKIIHTATNTINFIEVDAGSEVPPHQHIHEQCAFVLEGTFQLTVNGTPQIMEKGMFAIIPPNVPHGGLAITDCKLIDLFAPPREDFKVL
nr:cupin domain-containing protein [uncultured Mucilaginibacter sp.]